MESLRAECRNPEERAPLVPRTTPLIDCTPRTLTAPPSKLPLMGCNDMFSRCQSNSLALIGSQHVQSTTARGAMNETCDSCESVKLRSSNLRMDIFLSISKQTFDEPTAPVAMCSLESLRFSTEESYPLIILRNP